MLYRATHRIRFFNVVYNTSKGSYIERCIDIGIHMASTVVALKVLVGSFAQMFTYIAGLRGIARIYNHHRDPIQPSLILQKEAKLSERPSSILILPSSVPSSKYCIISTGPTSKIFRLSSG